ncbi:NAD(P)/FAD-dependent oxidoreductase [Rossellomorea sp. H39__3]
MTKKVIIIGAVGGGATTASQLRKLDETMEIIVLERTDHLSYGACGMPYYLGDVIKDRESLFAATPESLQTKKGLDVRMKHEALKIDRDHKTLHIRNHSTNEDYEEAYDALVLATGASSILPDIPGLEQIPAFHLRTVADMDRMKQYLTTEKPTSCAIIGGGYIGVEMAENLSGLGMNVAVVERSPQLIHIIDPEAAEIVQKHLEENRVDVFLDDGLQEVAGPDQLKLDSGKIIQADCLLLAVGIKPNNSLAEQAGLSLGESGESRRMNSCKPTTLPSTVSGTPSSPSISSITPLSRCPSHGPPIVRLMSSRDISQGIPCHSTGCSERPSRKFLISTSLPQV